MDTIDLFHGNYKSGIFCVPKIDTIYKIANYYFCIFEDRLKILDLNYNLILDVYISEDKASRKLISLYKNKIQIQEINISKHSTLLSSLNLNGSTYEPKQSFPFYLPIVNAWADERMLIETRGYGLELITLGGIRCRYYKLIQPIRWISNCIFYNNSIYFLAIISEDCYFSIVKLDDNYYQTNYFSISFYDQNYLGISINIENDSLNILCPTNDKINVFYIEKPLSDLKFIERGIGKIYHKGYDLGNLVSYKKNIVDADNFYKIKDLIKNSGKPKPVEVPIIEIEKFATYLPLYVEPISNTKEVVFKEEILDKPQPVVFIRDSSYINYLKWILDNYYNMEIKTVIFYHDFMITIPYNLADRDYNHTINLLEFSKNAKNYSIPFKKINLFSGNQYVRRLDFNGRFMNSKNLDKLHDSRLDYLTKIDKIESITKDKITNILVILGISKKEIVWSPYMYYKIDMELLREMPFEYFKKVFDIFNRDLSLKPIMKYLFYTIIYRN